MIDKFLRNYSGLSPLVSVVICTHDGDVKYLKRAMDSLKKQDLSPYDMEVLTTYDGTPNQVGDNYLEDACKGTKFPVRAFFSKEKSGYYTIPRNRALPMTRGLYIYNMDADNEISPEHLSTLIHHIRTPHETDGWPHFVYSRRLYIKDDGSSPLKLPIGPSPFVPWKQDAIKTLLQGPNHNFVD